MYENIHFMYFQNFHCLLLIANTHKLLLKQNVMLSDRNTYIHKIRQAVTEVLGTRYFKLYLHRFDNCVDLELEPEVMYEYLHLLSKHKSVYQYMKKINEYESSVYLTSKNGQRRINIYDKFEREESKYLDDYEIANSRTGISLENYKKTQPPFYEYYSNIFRIEVQNTKKFIQNESNKIVSKYDTRTELQKEVDELQKHLRRIEYLKARKRKLNKKAYKSIYENLDKYPRDLKSVTLDDLEAEEQVVELMIEELQTKKESESIELEDVTPEIELEDNLVLDRDICGYWSKSSMNEYYFNVLKDYLYTGKYYKLRKAKQIIKNSNYSNCDKAHLVKFIEDVHKYGITNITTTANSSSHSKWCIATVNEYTRNLSKLGIYIEIFDLVSNKAKLEDAKQKINKSNYSKSWKLKLIDFVNVVSKYGLEDAIAKNNREITNKIVTPPKKCRYGSATVDRYIDKLSAINLNPVTLDNTSTFDELESLYTLIVKTAQDKYFDIEDDELLESIPPTPVISRVRRNIPVQF